MFWVLGMIIKKNKSKNYLQLAITEIVKLTVHFCEHPDYVYVRLAFYFTNNLYNYMRNPDDEFIYLISNPYSSLRVLSHLKHIALSLINTHSGVLQYQINISVPASFYGLYHLNRS